MGSTPLDLKRLRVRPLAERDSLTRVDDILIDPDAPPPKCLAPQAVGIAACARDIRAARTRRGRDPHLRGPSASKWCRPHSRPDDGSRLDHPPGDQRRGSIHDWEYAWLGRSTESVRANVATGTFGAWDETGRNLHLALLAGGLKGEGYGQSLGRFLTEDGTTLPTVEELESSLRAEPSHPLARRGPICSSPCERTACPPGVFTSRIAGNRPRSSPVPSSAVCP